MSWEKMQLSEIALIRSGGTPLRSNTKFYNGSIPWAKISDLDTPSGFVDSTEEQITEEGLRAVRGRLFHPGTILFAMYGSVGKTAVANVDMYSNQAILGIQPDASRLNPRFLLHWLKSIKGELNEAARGVTQQNLNAGQVKSLKVPLPPLPIQQRIAAVLDEVDALRQKREQSMEVLDLAWRAVAHSLLGDLLSNDQGWPSTHLEDLGQITSGVTKGRKLRGAARAVPYMRVANVQDGYISLSEIKTIEATEEEIERFRLKSGDVLLTEGGDPDKLGRGTVWRGDVDECIFQNHIFRVRLDTRIILPEVASYIIGSDYGKKYFLRSAKQTTGIAFNAT